MLTIEKKKVVKKIEVETEEDVYNLALTKNQLLTIKLCLGTVAGIGPIRDDINAIWNSIDAINDIEFDENMFKADHGMLWLNDGVKFND